MVGREGAVTNVWSAHVVAAAAGGGGGGGGAAAKVSLCGSRLSAHPCLKQKSKDHFARFIQASRCEAEGTPNSGVGDTTEYHKSVLYHRLPRYRVDSSST